MRNLPGGDGLLDADQIEVFFVEEDDEEDVHLAPSSVDDAPRSRNAASGSAFVANPVVSRPSGRVIGIIKRNWNSTPKIRIQTRQVENLLDKRIIVTVDSWDRLSRYPSGGQEKWFSTVNLCLELDILILTFDTSNNKFCSLSLKGLHIFVSVAYVSNTGFFNNSFSNYLIISQMGNVSSNNNVLTETDKILSSLMLFVGDDCVSIVSGSSNIKMKRLYCGSGHGIRIGSLGKDNSTGFVSKVVVVTALLRDTTNGLRIKTWQGGHGYVRGIRYENVQMENVANPDHVLKHQRHI
ncbi:Polygalacturonase QRT2 [Linum perenne]